MKQLLSFYQSLQSPKHKSLFAYAKARYWSIFGSENEYWRKFFEDMTEVVYDVPQNYILSLIDLQTSTVEQLEKFYDEVLEPMFEYAMIDCISPYLLSSDPTKEDFIYSITELNEAVNRNSNTWRKRNA